MKRLIEQILKFGIVGVIAFFVDYVITAIPPVLLKNNDLIYVFKVIGFVVSCIVNYLLSVKYVFTDKKEMDKKKEFTVFVILSAIGLVINYLIIFICYSKIYKNSPALKELIPESLVTTITTLIATAVVMVYNFISRKIFLEGGFKNNQNNKEIEEQ